MKKGASFPLSSSWWAKNKPALLESSGLGAALKEYEKNKTKHGLALAALLKVDAARKKGIGDCVGPAFADTKAALQKADAIGKASQAHMKALETGIRDIDLAVRKLPLYLRPASSSKRDAGGGGARHAPGSSCAGLRSAPAVTAGPRAP